MLSDSARQAAIEALGYFRKHHRYITPEYQQNHLATIDAAITELQQQYEVVPDGEYAIDQNRYLIVSGNQLPTRVSEFYLPTINLPPGWRLIRPKENK